MRSNCSTPSSPAPAPKSDRLWLSGLVICGKCGRAMCGWSEDGWDSYTCSTFRKHGANNPAGCRLHRVRVEVIEQHLDTYLADLGRSLDSLVKGGESGLLQALFRSLDRDKDRLKDLRTRMEGYLMEALEEIIEPVRLLGGRKRFEIDTPEGLIRLDLPGCTDPNGLEYLYDWVSSVKRHRGIAGSGSWRVRSSGCTGSGPSWRAWAPAGSGQAGDVQGGYRAGPAEGQRPRPGCPGPGHVEGPFCPLRGAGTGEAGAGPCVSQSPFPGPPRRPGPHRAVVPIRAARPAASVATSLA